VDRVHSTWTGWGGAARVHRGLRWCGQEGSPVLAGGGGGGRAKLGGFRGVLTGALAVAKRRHDGGEERRWLELVARAKESARGKRGGEGRECSSPFYRGRGSAWVGWSGW
jgi:hypothetical protein